MPTLTAPSSAPPSSPVTADPLSGLRDIHLPSDISILPLAPGWWLLAALLLITVAALSIAGWRRRQRNRYRRHGTALLAALRSTAGDAETAQLQAINQLLKRVALVAYPNTPVAGSHGDDWLHFLQCTAPTLPQPPELAEILTKGLYAPGEQPERVAIFRGYARSWIERHQPEHKITLPKEAGDAAL